ncbi:unnamed protein product [Durusdinium trenchii]|uniref:EamA domain-containing protein n=2 Tax=Durusdinium trenchii TaxID=1381693 RepID=A0ABP0NUQ5_9DINO
MARFATRRRLWLLPLLLVLGLCFVAPQRASHGSHAPPPAPARGAACVRNAGDAQWLRSETGGVALLNVVTMLFGSNQVLIKTLETEDANTGAMDSFLCMSLRFGIAAIAMFFVAMSQRPRGVASTDAQNEGCILACGAELAVWLFLAFMLQAVGLQYTTASSGALLGSLTIVLVPLLSLLDGRRISQLTWGSVGLATMGTALFVGPNALQGAFCSFGDVLELGSAALFAVQMWRCEKLIRQVPEHQVVGLTCFQLALVAGFSLMCVLAEGTSMPGVLETVAQLAPGEWMSVVTMGLVTTAFCLWAESFALQNVDASVAALIYACEPIWGAIFAYLWRGETLEGPCAMCGAGLLLLASMAGVMASQTKASETFTLDRRGA